jgi:transposase-like protein
MKTQPSLLETVSKFNSEEKCVRHFEAIRWPDGLRCVRCGSDKANRMGGKAAERFLYWCPTCRHQYTVTTGTIFHDSHIPLIKWFLAIYLICSAKKGVSSLQLKRELELGSYESALYMTHRIRIAMREDPKFCQKFSGICEVDETYIGGKSKGPRGRGAANKVPVVAIKNRTSGTVRMQVMEDVSASSLAEFIREHAQSGSEIHTDEFKSYVWLDSSEFAHKSVNHSQTYVAPGKVHTNGCENVWSLFKRGIMGVFHKVSEKYLPLYLDEFAFRFNNRDEFNLMDKVLSECF